MPLSIKAPAQTTEELRNQAYNLIVAHDHRNGSSVERNDAYWSKIRRRAIEVLTARGTPDTLDIHGTVDKVLEAVRKQG
jgi:hypothetical protein